MYRTPQNSRIHIVFKGTWNVLLDRPRWTIKQISLNQRIQIIQSMFADHNEFKLDISNKISLENPQMLGN